MSGTIVIRLTAEAHKRYYRALRTETSITRSFLEHNPRKSRRTELGDRSRERIRKSTLSLISKVGYGGPSISAIAKRSGLPASSLYWHFGSKQALLAAVAEDGAARWLALIPSWEDIDGQPLERLDKMLRAIAREFERQPEIIRLILMLYMERGKPDVVALGIIQRLRRSALAKFRPAIETLLDVAGVPKDKHTADELCDFALSFVNGCFVDHQINPNRAPFLARFQQLRTALLAIAKEWHRVPLSFKAFLRR